MSWVAGNSCIKCGKSPININRELCLSCSSKQHREGVDDNIVNSKYGKEVLKTQMQTLESVIFNKILYKNETCEILGFEYGVVIKTIENNKCTASDALNVEQLKNITGCLNNYLDVKAELKLLMEKHFDAHAYLLSKGFINNKCWLAEWYRDKRNRYYLVLNKFHIKVTVHGEKSIIKFNINKSSCDKAIKLVDFLTDLEKE